MPTYNESKKLENVLYHITRKIHLKNHIYKPLILMYQKLKLRELERIVSNSKKLKNPKVTKDKTIIFHSVDARHMPKTYIEGAISKSLQIRGYKTKMIICDKALSMCTTFHRIDHPPNEWSCNNCSNFSHKFYDTVGLDYSTYKDYYDNLDYVEDIVNELHLHELSEYIYKGIRVGEHARISAIRYSKGKKSSVVEYYRILKKELINAIIAVEVAERVIEKEKPDVLVTSHGCYSSWGSFADCFKKHNIRVCVWTEKDYEMTLDKNKAKEHFKEYIKHRGTENLTDDELHELILNITKRQKGEVGELELYKHNKPIDIPYNDFDRVYGMFVNVPWDSSLADSNRAFDGIFDWIDKTIEYFNKHPNKLLIIKTHPSELTSLSEETVSQYIKYRYILPRNIIVLPPDTSISTYDLIDKIDVGIVYNGTVGIELALSNVPNIVVGKAYYSDIGFTHDVKSLSEYKKLLDNNSLSVKNKKLVQLFAYYLFNCMYVPQTFIYMKNFLNLGWNILNLYYFEKGFNRELDTICNYIINDGGFIYERRKNGN